MGTMTGLATTPRVSIGLPVYNGQLYLAAAIQSILSQNYRDFELIICDNASTDDTQGICLHYAARDPRVRYERQSHNRGAAPNFNRAFELGRGEYFKWAAHDDFMEPDYLGRCVALLDRHRDAVLAHSVVRLTDEKGAHIGIYDPGSVGTAGMRPSQRLARRLSTRRATEVFGLIRVDALRQTELCGSYIGSDKVLLAELALMGRFVIDPAPLFSNRGHTGRGSARGVHPHWRLAWFETDKAGKRMLPTVSFYIGCVRAIRRHVASRSERLRCFGELTRSLGRDHRLLSIVAEVIVAIEPRAYGPLVLARDRWLVNTDPTAWHRRAS